ncbi:XIAP-associated factor 1 isoform X1 [Labrus mixtus]|uniref:XIAP-associated factor 1 isoform X1 n=1 Tax=Labrus mixtus TaxID=508554 RepID=UPI0029C01A80|nr:XIAP-associated factor 1 isoform X1 [Labrus mixtus]
MDLKEGTRQCRQCHKPVAETNFALHETHCRRFLCVCPNCGDAVPREQLDQHREEQHTQVRCSKCNQRMERCQLLDHESDECGERMQSCHFCELEMPFKKLDEHAVVCGSRTERCSDCGRYVTLRDQPEHALTCSDDANTSGPPQTTRTLPPNKVEGRASSPAEEDEQLERILSASSEHKEAESEEDEEESEASPRLSSTYRAISLSNGPRNGPGGDPDQISTCPHCHLALPVPTLRWHQVKCRNHALFR